MLYDCVAATSYGMDIIQATILGVVQGITEFLPISSSGHLVLAPWIFGWDYQGVSFDVALHIGTLLGVVAYFWRSWRDMVVSFRKIKPSGSDPDGFRALANRRLLFFLILATIPGALAGLFLQDFAEGIFRSPWIVASSLILFSFVIFFAEKFGRKIHDITHIDWKRAVAVGLFQALALVPGISRSGATISAGLFLGLSRQEAARFSFLLATPIIFGAGVFKFPDMIREGIDLVFVLGVVVSALSGFFAIKFLFKYLERGSYIIFVVYRIILGLAIFSLIWWG